MKDVLTTSEVARVCRVAPRTVCLWIDEGELNAHRVGSHRRVYAPDLMQFMADRNMPRDWSEMIADVVQRLNDEQKANASSTEKEQACRRNKR